MKLIKGHTILKVINKVLGIFNRKINRTMLEKGEVIELRYYWEKSNER